MAYSGVTTPRPRRGRRRDPEADVKILDAALELLVERGFHGASMEAAAERVGVGKMTVYRRHSNRIEMLTKAIGERIGIRPVTLTGDSRADVRATVEVLAETVLRGTGAILLGAVLAEEERHPELLTAYKQRVLWPRRKLLRDVLRRARHLGEVRKDVEVELMVDLVWGASLARHVTGIGREDRFVDQITEVIWRGLGLDRLARTKMWG